MTPSADDGDEPDDDELKALVAGIIERERERGSVQPDWIATQALIEILPADLQRRYPLLRAAVLAQLRQIARQLCGVRKPQMPSPEPSVEALEADAASRSKHAEALRRFKKWRAEEERRRRDDEERRADEE